MEMGILAFDIGGTRGRCCVAGRDGTHSAVASLKREGHEDGSAWLRRLLECGRETARQSAKLDRVAVSFGGPVAPDGRVVSVHVPGWEQVDLRAEMTKAFGLPVEIENDANCGALGEYRFGAARGVAYAAYFTVSTGIGGGVILGGKLYRGAHGMAAEFGHIVLQSGPDAPQYAAGKPGVLEALASGPAIERDAAAALRKLGRPVPAGFGAKYVFESGEAWAIDVRERAIGHLGRGVAAVVCAFDLDRVVIGGGVALAGEALFKPLRAAVDRFLPAFMEGKVAVVPAALGDYSALLGAVALCGA
jgi:glucokinase